jgi:hypothetical protein
VSRVLAFVIFASSFTDPGESSRRFDLGLILDSAEVLGEWLSLLPKLMRSSFNLIMCVGVLLDDEGRECGRATFEFA